MYSFVHLALAAALLLAVLPSLSTAQDTGYYVGAISGSVQLSGDPTTIASPDGFATSGYKPETGLAVNPQFFAMKTRRYMHDHGITEECLTRVAVKNFKNGSLNPAAWRRKALDAAAIDDSPMVCDPLRQYHFCSPSEGAAAIRGSRATGILCCCALRTPSGDWPSTGPP